MVSEQFQVLNLHITFQDQNQIYSYQVDCIRVLQLKTKTSFLIYCKITCKPLMNLYEIEKKNTFILNTRIFSDISGENFGTITCWMIPNTFICSILLFSYFKHRISCVWHLQIADLRRVQICEQMNNCRIFLYFSAFQYYAKKYSKQRKQLHICSQLGSTAWRSGRTAHCSLWPNSTLTESTYLLEVWQICWVLLFRKD